LKSKCLWHHGNHEVVPPVGTWIEIHHIIIGLISI